MKRIELSGNFTFFVSLSYAKSLDNMLIIFKASRSHLPSSTGCPIKGTDKKNLAGAAHGLNSQFLDLFVFSISIRFIWCII